MSSLPRVHPAFVEAKRIRDGVRSLPDEGLERQWAYIDLTRDHDGSIAMGLIDLYETYARRNVMEALVLAFLAGQMCERDR